MAGGTGAHTKAEALHRTPAGTRNLLREVIAIYRGRHDAASLTGNGRTVARRPLRAEAVRGGARERERGGARDGL